MRSIGFFLVVALGLGGCGDDEHHHHHPDAATADASTTDAGPQHLAHTLLVAYDGKLAAFDVATGDRRAGEITDVTSPVDLQALSTGHVAVNLTTRNEILVVDAYTMTVTARIPSSDIGGTNPVHLYFSPERDDKHYLVALNDGAADVIATNSALFVDITPGSATFLEPVGEVGLGLGHHKAAFSPEVSRVSISNIADCDDLIEVYDYSDLSAITRLASLTGAAAGVGQDGRPCDETGRPGPHGGATAWTSGRAYHNLTGWEMIASVEQGASPPTFTLLETDGSGAGYTKSGKDGRYVYSLQRTPREGDSARPGADCQIGQLVVIDGMEDEIAAQVPLLYTGPDCDTALPEGAEAVGPGHILISKDGETLFITTAANGVGANATQQLVVDVSDPATPVQLPSIEIGDNNGRRNQDMSGDGKYVLVTNNTDETVSVIDTELLEVVRTITVGPNLVQVVAYGTDEGPSPPQGPQ